MTQREFTSTPSSSSSWLPSSSAVELRDRKSTGNRRSSHMHGLWGLHPRSRSLVRGQQPPGQLCPRLRGKEPWNSPKVTFRMASSCVVSQSKEPRPRVHSVWTKPSGVGSAFNVNSDHTTEGWIQCGESSTRGSQAHTFDPSTQADGSQWVRGQPGVWSKFQDSYIEKPRLEAAGEGGVRRSNRGT